MTSYVDLFPEEIHKIQGESRVLLLTLPSVVGVGEEFPLKASMLSISGMPDEASGDTVSLNPSSHDLQVPEKLEFSPDDKGMLSLPGLSATREGVYFIEAEVDGSPSRPVRSNAIQVMENPRARLYWGDIHVHTSFSNCHADYAKHPSFGYWYAKEVTHLDFAAAADHLRGLSQERWSELRRVNEEYNSPGEFVTLLGFESSHSKDHGGDINAYYREGEADYFWLDREDMKGIRPAIGLDVLWNWLDEQGKESLTIPHHTGRAAKYRDFELPYYNPESETVFEIFSMWGSSEGRNDEYFLRSGKTDRRAYFQDALDLGYKYGVIGSSDTHHTMPGTPTATLPTPYHHPPNALMAQGLAAVYASALTRAAIFDSLACRDCYATTSTRPILRFYLDGVPMGRTVDSAGGPREMKIQLCTSLLPAQIEILRNNRVVANLRQEEPMSTHTYTDEADPSDLWIRDAPKNPRPFIHYYVRVSYHGVCAGITAWSSPIWVEAAP